MLVNIFIRLILIFIFGPPQLFNPGSAPATKLYVRSTFLIDEYLYIFYRKFLS